MPNVTRRKADPAVTASSSTQATPTSTAKVPAILDLRGGPEPTCIAAFGGVYSNHLALSAVLADAQHAGADQLLCLGDIGGFGPHPDRSAEILRASGVITIQGNYDDSVGNGLDDCQCGYTDPRDNHYAQISYDYTLAHTSDENRAWFRELPQGVLLSMGGRRLHFAHGSPRRVNEFLWESTTPEPFVRRLLEETETDILFVTHTGIPWVRAVPQSPAGRTCTERRRVLRRGIVNVGAIGRPANDGDVRVWYALVRAGDAGLDVELRPVSYAHERLAEEMEAESLPDEFVETILTGWWTTCLEILPAKERARGRY